MGNRLQEAARLHQAGFLQHAVDLYKQVLNEAPKNSDALHLLGLALHQLHGSRDNRDGPPVSLGSRR